MKRLKRNRNIIIIILSVMIICCPFVYPQNVLAGEAGSTDVQQSSDSTDGEEAGTDTSQPTDTEESTATDTNQGDTAQQQNPPADTTAPVVIPEIPVEEEEPTHAPKVIVSGCSVNTEQIEIGTDVTFTVSLKNTSPDVALYNMKMTYESVSGELIPLEASNSRYISNLSAGAVTTLTFSMHIPKDISNYCQKLTINMEYEDEDAVSYNSTEQVFVNIERPLSFHADNPIVPLQVVSGTSAAISINLFNTGKAPIYNVSCQMKCRGFLDNGSSYVGTIAPESSAMANLNPIAANRQYGPLGDPGAEKYGPVNGTIIVTYEDEEGNVYTEEVKMNTEITIPPDEVEEPKIDKVKYSSQWWVSIVVLLVIIDGIIIFAAYYFQKHRV